MRPFLCNSIVTLAANICLATIALAADVPHDPEAFTGYAEAKLQPEISTVPVHTTGILSLTIGPIKDNLSPLYDACQANPDACDAAIHQHALEIRQTLGIAR